MCTTTESDLALLEKAQSFLRCLKERRPPSPASIDAWDRFYERYSNVVRRFVERRGVFGVDADDCVQEVWFYVVRKLKDFRPPRNRLGIHAWLYRISASVATNWYRSRERIATPLQDVRELGETVAERTPSADSLSDGQWHKSLVRRFVGAMRRHVSDINRRVVEMRFLEERSVSDVATALGLTREQVWYRQHRALARIRSWAKTSLNNGNGHEG